MGKYDWQGLDTIWLDFLELSVKLHFSNMFFFHCIFRRMTTVWENPFTAGFGLSTWLPFRIKLHGLLESLTALGRKFWLEKLDYIYFWKRARLPKKLWREDPENNHRFQKKKPCLRKSTAAFRKIGHYLCQNPLLLLVKSVAVFWDKATTTLGKTGRERFFLRRRVLQNRSGALLK